MIQTFDKNQIDEMCDALIGTISDYKPDAARLSIAYIPDVIGSTVKIIIKLVKDAPCSL